MRLNRLVRFEGVTFSFIFVPFGNFLNAFLLQLDERQSSGLLGLLGKIKKQNKVGVQLMLPICLESLLCQGILDQKNGKGNGAQKSKSNVGNSFAATLFCINFVFLFAIPI